MSSSHELADLAVVALAALVCGLILTRLRQPPIVGYILAGVLLGPAGIGLVEDRESIALLAELGVLMLLFVVGMKLSLRAFRSVYRVALLGAFTPLALSVAVTLAISRVLGWPIELAVLLGFMISLSSTAVAIKMLEDIGELGSEVGRRAVGILIAQDLAFVPMLLILNGMAQPGGFAYLDIVPIAGALGFLVVFIWYMSERQRFALPHARWVRGDSDLVPLAALGVCFAAAAVSGALGLSTAYGAFQAGLFIGRTTARRRMIHTTQPIQSVLMMVFALSIGLLIDLRYIADNLTTVAVLLVIVLIGKSAVNIAVLRLLGEPWPRAFLTGTVLGQIGEFSFVLAAAGMANGLIDDEGGRLAVTVIALSLIVSPLWFVAVRRLHRLAEAGISRGDELLFRLYGNEAAAFRSSSAFALKGFLLIARALGHGGRSALAGLPLGGSAKETGEDADDAEPQVAASEATASDSEPEKAAPKKPAKRRAPRRKGNGSANPPPDLPEQTP